MLHSVGFVSPVVVSFSRAGISMWSGSDLHGLAIAYHTPSLVEQCEKDLTFSVDPAEFVGVLQSLSGEFTVSFYDDGSCGVATTTTTPASRLQSQIPITSACVCNQRPPPLSATLAANIPIDCAVAKEIIEVLTGFSTATHNTQKEFNVDTASLMMEVDLRHHKEELYALNEKDKRFGTLSFECSTEGCPRVTSHQDFEVEYQLTQGKEMSAADLSSTIFHGKFELETLKMALYNTLLVQGPRTLRISNQGDLQVSVVAESFSVFYFF
ncbi:hypothetical protein Pelo_17639 [Pelomyxa schiedti]|nr:hypothetical protein Pelo_17639 [Pelomyxa schiedti]